ncbi:hypothetical protein LEP1GSC132_2538 [Leptospira kirschneri str. 200803703]|uniref:Uncharacterized protein n=1 Tax=Leptospira kirschneri str. 200802841 TaxID=1193047 RepID=A0A828Y210_9LEPT|nr:hypothetical protein LEP1GSC131_3002 [Leptospira kirschneri str. 200802841]EKP05485.1 hypothetical protein LEP1GSC018_1514 [Leptospira kirschneri str. 2008720114]EMK18800.1 hypothetical protein LEP1GSC042_3913 [Leptospira kirschneri serovar Bim str. PUO 1247]EMN03521.1 hypothetical protein LEP1GSC046_0791 [Leptospira kirschneri serovar Bim str. 1051]EMN26214.1 hypothetical protein LEP1GSC065_2955 [Leptospira kirschneri serovar Sokoine str. RM1]EMO67651.1 hypothetical protein LEP1GSC132_2538
MQNDRNRYVDILKSWIILFLKKFIIKKDSLLHQTHFNS